MGRHKMNHGVLGLVGALFVGVASFSLTGCTEESSLEETLFGPEAMAADEVGGWIGELRMEDLARELDLSVQQTAQLSDAFSDLESGLSERRQRWSDARQRGQEQRGRRGRGDRSRGEPGGRFPGEARMEAMLDGPRPFQDFLQRSAEILDRDQFVSLAQSLEEGMGQRAERPDQRQRRGGSDAGRGGKNSRDRGMRGEGMLGRRLGIEPDEMEKLRDIRAQYGEELRALHESVRDEEKAASAAVGEAKALVEKARAEVLEILSEEQLDELESRKAEFMERRIDARIERLPGQLSDRAELLAAALDLDDDQSRRVGSILNGTVEERVAILRSVASGDTEAQVAAFQMMAVRDEARSEIRAVLDAEQVEAAESLRDVLERGVAGERGRGQRRKGGFFQGGRPGGPYGGRGF